MLYDRLNNFSGFSSNNSDSLHYTAEWRTPPTAFNRAWPTREQARLCNTCINYVAQLSKTYYRWSQSSHCPVECAFESFQHPAAHHVTLLNLSFVAVRTFSFSVHTETKTHFRPKVEKYRFISGRKRKQAENENFHIFGTANEIRSTSSCIINQLLAIHKH